MQAEILSGQTVAQDLLIDDLQKTISNLTKILHLYEASHDRVAINSDGTKATPLDEETKTLISYYRATMTAGLNRTQNNFHKEGKSDILALVEHIDGKSDILALVEHVDGKSDILALVEHVDGKSDILPHVEHVDGRS